MSSKESDKMEIYEVYDKKDGTSTIHTKLVKTKTERRFGLIKFYDKYAQECSLQDSSIATEACIWLGVDNTGDLIEGPSGKKNEDVGARMHLTQSMVKELLPYLIEFAETGEYILNMKLAKKSKSKQKKA